MPTPRLLAAILLASAALSASGCAQEAIEGGTYSGLTPSATPTYGVPASDLHEVDLASQLRQDPRVPAFLRELLTNCPDCFTETTAWRDVSGDGREDAIMTLSEAQIPAATVIFGIRDGRTAPIFIHMGRRGVVTFEGRDLVLTRPMYTSTDPECCATGTPLVSRFRWQDERFVQTSRTGGGTGLTTYDPDDRVIT